MKSLTQGQAHEFKKKRGEVKEEEVVENEGREKRPEVSEPGLTRRRTAERVFEMGLLTSDGAVARFINQRRRREEETWRGITPRAGRRKTGPLWFPRNFH